MSKGTRPFIHTHDFDEARSGLRALYGEGVGLLPGDLAAFEWRADVARLGPLAAVAGVASGVERIIGDADSYVLLSTRAGGFRVATAESEVDVVPGRSAAVLAATSHYAIRFSPAVQTATLVLDRRFVEAQLQALTGVEPAGPIRFTLGLGTDVGTGAFVRRLTGAVLAALEDGAEIVRHPLVAAGLCESVVRALLLGHAHDHDHLLERPAPPSSQTVVRLAEEYLDARAAEPVLLSDVAASLGVSVRSIDTAFRARRGCTAEAFLQRRRLELARERLLSAEPDTTVTDVARSLGFPHAGPFAAAYTKTFGERPEETRTRSRVALPEAAASPTRPGPEKIAALSPRQREVCERVARGMLHKQIAAELGISEKMVQRHASLGMARFGVRSTAELARLWEREAT